jgi:hypothetical protein
MIILHEVDLKKYPAGTPHWRKDPIERYECEKHGLPTIYLRDSDIVIHATTDSECV